MCDAAVLSNYRSQYIAAAALARTASGEAAILLLLLLRSRASRSQPRIDMIESNAMLYYSLLLPQRQRRQQRRRRWRKNVIHAAMVSTLCMRFFFLGFNIVKCYMIFLLHNMYYCHTYNMYIIVLRWSGAKIRMLLYDVMAWLALIGPAC